MNIHKYVIMDAHNIEYKCKHKAGDNFTYNFRRKTTFLINYYFLSLYALYFFNEKEYEDAVLAV